MARAHCFVAEVSAHNENVMIEVGRMQAFHRPLLLLKSKGSNDLPTNLEGSLFAEYAGQGTGLVERLREELRTFPEFVASRAPREGAQRLERLRLEIRAADVEVGALSMLGDEAAALARTSWILMVAADPARRAEMARAGVEFEVASAYVAWVEAARFLPEMDAEKLRRLGSGLRLYYALRDAAEVALAEKDAARARVLLGEARPYAKVLDRSPTGTVFRDEIARYPAEADALLSTGT